MKRFVVISGLPGSGKSTLAQRLALSLGLPIIDKDDLLEALFGSEGFDDAAQRQTLSRRSDELLREAALAADRAILVSHWHLPGMREDSGTPTDWLTPDDVFNIHCMCSPEIAAERFLRRTRHPGHRDGERSYQELLASIRAVACLGRLEIGPALEVDTSAEVDLPALVRAIAARLICTLVE